MRFRLLKLLMQQKVVYSNGGKDQIITRNIVNQILSIDPKFSYCLINKCSYSKLTLLLTYTLR